MVRSADAMQESAFTVTKPDGFVPAHHPLRAIRVLMNKAPTAMNPSVQRDSRWQRSGRVCAGRPGPSLVDRLAPRGHRKNPRNDGCRHPLQQPPSRAASDRLHLFGEFRQLATAIGISIILPGHPRIDEYHLRAIFVGARRCATCPGRRMSGDRPTRAGIGIGNVPLTHDRDPRVERAARQPGAGFDLPARRHHVFARLRIRTGIAEPLTTAAIHLRVGARPGEPRHACRAIRGH